MAPTTNWSEIIHLTATSPSKTSHDLDTMLKHTIAVASESQLHDALVEICRQIPEAAKIEASILVQAAGRTRQIPMEQLAREDFPRASKKRRRDVFCENCRGDVDDSEDRSEVAGLFHGGMHLEQPCRNVLR